MKESLWPLVLSSILAGAWHAWRARGSLSSAPRLHAFTALAVFFLLGPTAAPISYQFAAPPEIVPRTEESSPAPKVTPHSDKLLTPSQSPSASREATLPAATSLWSLVLAALAANLLTVLAVYVSISYFRSRTEAAKLVADTTKLGFGACELLAWVIGVIFVVGFTTHYIADWFGAGGTPGPAEASEDRSGARALAADAPMDDILFSILMAALAANGLMALAIHAVRTHRLGLSVTGTSRTMFHGLSLLGLRVYSIFFALFILSAIYSSARQWVAGALGLGH